jgi:hypothetical protein
MYLIMAFRSNYVSFGRSKNYCVTSRRMIPRPAQQSGNGRKTWQWVLEACASSGSALSLDYALLENRIFVSFFGWGDGWLSPAKKKTFSCYTCIAALVSLINSEYISLHLQEKSYGLSSTSFFINVEKNNFTEYCVNKVTMYSIIYCFF